MRIPNLGETELLVPLHEAMFEQPMWRTFLSRLRLASGADAAAIVLDTQNADPALFLEGDADGAMFAGARLAVLREGRVYDAEELREALPHLTDMAEHAKAVRLSGDTGLDLLLVLASDTELGADIASLLSALAPHVLVALKVLAGIERERARSEISAEAFARINFGWISLDANRRIVDCDPQAERLLRQPGLLRSGHYGRLMTPSRTIDGQLQDLLREFASNPKARPRAFNLSHDPWIDILVAPLRLAALAGGKDAVAIVYFRGDRSSSETRAEQLVDLFDLTPSEARVAWSMAQGLSIAEAAEEHGLTIETARNYSKKIYAKTGARGQVDLVRHVLTGVLALA